MPELQDPDIFRTILESLQTGVYVVGRDGRILFWNQGAEKITGYLRHEALGRFCRENVLAHCNDHNCVQCGVSCLLPVLCMKESRVKARFTFGIRRGTGFPSTCGLWLFVIP